MTDVITPDQLAERLGVPRRRVIEWNATYRWPHIRIGRRIRWTPEQVEQILRKHVITGGEIKASDGRTKGSKARAS